MRTSDNVGEGNIKRWTETHPLPVLVTCSVSAFALGALAMTCIFVNGYVPHELYSLQRQLDDCNANTQRLKQSNQDIAQAKSPVPERSAAASGITSSSKAEHAASPQMLEIETPAPLERTDLDFAYVREHANKLTGRPLEREKYLSDKIGKVFQFYAFLRSIDRRADPPHMLVDLVGQENAAEPPVVYVPVDNQQRVFALIPGDKISIDAVLIEFASDKPSVFRLRLVDFKLDKPVKQ
jgi:hypothetical protein